MSISNMLTFTKASIVLISFSLFSLSSCNIDPQNNPEDAQNVYDAVSGSINAFAGGIRKPAMATQLQEDALSSEVFDEVYIRLLNEDGQAIIKMELRYSPCYKERMTLLERINSLEKIFSTSGFYDAKTPLDDQKNTVDDIFIFKKAKNIHGTVLYGEEATTIYIHTTKEYKKYVRKNAVGKMAYLDINMFNFQNMLNEANEGYCHFTTVDIDPYRERMPDGNLYEARYKAKCYDAKGNCDNNIHNDLISKSLAQEVFSNHSMYKLLENEKDPGRFWIIDVTDDLVVGDLHFDEEGILKCIFSLQSTRKIG
ncbi:MAG: hypothetical protein AAF502_19025 [Bacteroidota bacterium]